MNYYYADAMNQPVGPISDEQLKALHRAGTISHDTHVLPEGAAEWQTYGSVALPPPPLSQVLTPVIRSIQSAPVAPPSLPLTSPTQTCPFCAEQISPAAKKCKHCGETIDVVLRAAEEAQRMSSRQPAVYMNAGGGAVAAASVPPRHNFPHVLHFVLTFFTMGLWLPIWILHYLFRNRSYYW